MNCFDEIELVGFIQGDSKIKMNLNSKRIREQVDDEVIYIGNKRKRAQENQNDPIEVIDLEAVKETEDNNKEPTTPQQQQQQQPQQMILNDLLYQYPRENPKIQIEVGCLIDCTVNAITSVIDYNSNISYLRTEIEDF